MGEVEIEPSLAPGLVDALYLVAVDHERQDRDHRRPLFTGWYAEAREQLLHPLLVEDDIERGDVTRRGILLLADGHAVDQGLDLLRLEVGELGREAERNHPPQHRIDAALLGVRHRLGLGGDGILGGDVDGDLGDRIGRVVVSLRGGSHEAKRKAQAEDQSLRSTETHSEPYPSCLFTAPSHQKPTERANVTAPGPI